MRQQQQINRKNPVKRSYKPERMLRQVLGLFLLFLFLVGMVFVQQVILAADQPAEQIELCASDREVNVTPGPDDVSFDWCTDPTSKCVIKLYDNAAYTAPEIRSGHDESEHAMHAFYFDGLNPATDYYYQIVCSKEGNWTDLEIKDSFETLAAEDSLKIENLNVKESAYKATFSWQTNQPATSQVYILNSPGGAVIAKAESGSLVSQHSLTVTGLNEQTTYNYYVMSATQNGTTCPANTSGEANCAATDDNNSFTTLKADSSPDANVILKVDHDRVCDEWLYCNAGAEVTDESKNPPQKENICFSVGLCNEMDEAGGCANIVNDNLQGELTFKHPADVDKIKNLSGYNKVGLDWGKRCINNGLSCSVDSDCGSSDRARCVDAKIAGYYPYSFMQETGVSINIPNYNFEEGTTRPWVVAGKADYYNTLDQASQNKVLKVVPNGLHGGIKAKVADEVSQTAVYVISFFAKTDSQDGLKIKVQLKPEGEGDYYRFEYYDREAGHSSKIINLKNHWQEYIMSLDMNKITQPVSGAVDIYITQDENGSRKVFYLDNIQMKSVLKVADPLYYIARSCRMYPDKSALACDYYDEQKGKDMRGWKGYCVEPDPAYSGKNYSGHPVCLQWWPVDVLTGEANIFNNEPVVGYSGRKPLYYCLASRGDYPYYEKKVAGYHQVGDGETATIGMADYQIYRDEITGLKLEGVEIDHNNTDYDDCNVVAATDGGFEDISSQPRGSGAKRGTMIFDSKNKSYWDHEFTDDYTKAGYTAAGLNKYIALRCSGQGAENDSAVASARLEFDEHDMLQNIEFKFVDGNGNGGHAKFYSANITYRGERCEYIAKVVTEDGENKAWVTRAQKNGWVNDNYLGYSYGQDYSPYGASVVDANLDDPAKWTEPLYVMPPEKSSLQAPYQIRAGSPYSVMHESQKVCVGGVNDGLACQDDEDCSGQVIGLCESAYLSGSNEPGYFCVDEGQPCTNDSDCADSCVSLSDGSGTYCAGPSGLCKSEGSSCSYNSTGTCQSKEDNVLYIGKTQCISGSSDKLGQSCATSQDCGAAGQAACVGINLDDSVVKKISGGVSAGRDRLANLFAKSYGVWKWDWSNSLQRMAYVPIDSYNWDISSAKGVEPKIEHILVNNRDDVDYEIVGQGAAILKFTSWVSPDQVPLVSYSVNWGDGQSTSESGLRIAPKTSLDNPHILVHYYQFNNNCTGGTVHYDEAGQVDYCLYRPQVTIRDNWGLSGTNNFSHYIRVYRPGTSLQTGVLEVDPLSLTYYSSNGIPQTQSFIVSNANEVGEDIEWKIAEESQSDKYFKDANGTAVESIEYKLEYPHYFGYQGSLAAAQKEKVYFTVSNIGSANAGEYFKTIRMMTTDGTQEKDVKIKLVIEQK